MRSALRDPGYLSWTRDARRSRTCLFARDPYGPGETTLNDRPRIPLRRRAGAVAASAAVVASCHLLAGCAPSTSPAPTPAPTPPLTQEQQDDQAFQAALSGFLDLPFQGETGDALRPFLTGDAFDDEVREIDEYQAAQQTVVGKDTYYGFRITSRGPGYAVAQACLDVSGTRVLDAGGRDVTTTRSPVVSLQLKGVVGDDGSWRISDLVPNDEVHACG
ncbi:hypothetical protein [Clavibacter michiganensis]|uniref:hypothetical protein n=2 Tax=Clavibacter michiganensis TaxID=28447 RepID=UPI0026DB6067|nr:hypothetical protein [Clavibacter michiganensis]MDO4129994.1 hypothetical protein [Clavibacter michiganensis]